MERVILGIGIDGPEVPLLFLCCFQVGRGFVPGKGYPLSVRRDFECVNRSLEISYHLGFAAFDQDTENVHLARTGGGEIDVASIRRERRCACALIAACELEPPGPVRSRDEDLGDLLAMLAVQPWSALGVGDHPPVRRRYHGGYILYLQRVLGRPCSGRLGECSGESDKEKRCGFHSRRLCHTREA